LFFAVIGCLLVAEALLFLFYGGGIQKIGSYFTKNPAPITGIILFEGDNCANCTKVEDFIKANNIDSKVAFTRLEVLNHPANANVLSDKAQTCGLDPAQIGVPFLWDGKRCILGYVDVIKFFSQKSVKKP